MADLRSRWRSFWYGEGSPLDLALARVLLAGTALWVVLSRPDLPQVLAFPPELWHHVTPERRLRFLLVLAPETERVLYRLLALALLAAALGVWSRWSCLLSGLLLYHFAPLETIIRSPNPYLRGLTIPTLGLLVLGFARAGDRLALWPRALSSPAPPWEYRWPLRLVQVLFCQVYAFAAYAKLVTSGLAWTGADNIRRYLLLLNQGLTASPEASLGYAVAAHPLACALLAWCGLGFELLFPLVIVSATARRVLLPAAVLFHAGNALLFRITFPNLPLLLLFVGWDRLRASVVARVGGGARSAVVAVDGARGEAA